jgi:hypothetical protein
MAIEFQLFVCDDSDKADEARTFLVTRGFNIVIEPTETDGLALNAEQYDGGDNYVAEGKWIVAGTQ